MRRELFTQDDVCGLDLLRCLQWQDLDEEELEELEELEESNFVYYIPSDELLASISEAITNPKARLSLAYLKSLAPCNVHRLEAILNLETIIQGGNQDDN